MTKQHPSTPQPSAVGEDSAVNSVGARLAIFAALAGAAAGSVGIALKRHNRKVAADAAKASAEKAGNNAAGLLNRGTADHRGESDLGFSGHGFSGRGFPGRGFSRRRSTNESPSAAGRASTRNTRENASAPVGGATAATGHPSVAGVASAAGAASSAGPSGIEPGYRLADETLASVKTNLANAGSSLTAPGGLQIEPTGLMPPATVTPIIEEEPGREGTA